MTASWIDVNFVQQRRESSVSAESRWRQCEIDGVDFCRFGEVDTEELRRLTSPLRIRGSWMTDYGEE